MHCVLLRPLWQTASLWIMTTSSVAALTAPCGFLTLWTFTLSPLCRSHTSWEQTSQVWLRPGTVEKGGREKGRLVGVRTVPQTFAIWSMLFLWIKIGSLLQISLSCCSLALYDWTTAQTWLLEYTAYLAPHLPGIAQVWWPFGVGCYEQAGRGHKMLWHASVVSVPWHILCLSLSSVAMMLLRDAHALTGHFLKGSLAIFYRFKSTTVCNISSPSILCILLSCFPTLLQYLLPWLSISYLLRWVMWFLCSSVCLLQRLFASPGWRFSQSSSVALFHFCL